MRVGTQAHQDSILLEAQLHGLQQGQEREMQMLQAAEHNAQGLRNEHELHASQVGGLPPAKYMCCRPAETNAGVAGWQRAIRQPDGTFLSKVQVLQAANNDCLGSNPLS